MSRVIAVRDAAVKTLQALPTVKSVRAFAGDLTLEGLGQRPLGLQELFVSVITVDNAPEDAPTDSDLRAAFGLFVIVRNQKDRLEREVMALDLAEQAFTCLHGSTFDLMGVGPALVGGMAPLDGEVRDALEKKGITVWALAWEQRITLGV